MGNHDVGRAMHGAAKAFWISNGDAEVTKEKALAILDAAAEDWRGADAEFDDYASPDEPLGRLMAIAFGPWGDTDTKKDAEDSGDHWYEKIYRPFRSRYNFC